MPRWLKYTILAIILVLLSSFPLARLLEEGVIEGYITNQNGPVAGASVEAHEVMDGETALTSSDSEGYYRIDGLPPGRYSLWITAANHTSVSIPRIPVGRGETVRKDVRLSQLGRQTLSP
jgi:hypothetical protein